MKHVDMNIVATRAAEGLPPKRILPEDVKGGDVLLAVEVAGSSMPYDRGLKARIYARHDVAELWVVDTSTRVTWVHQRPDADGNWGSVEKIPAGSALSPLALAELSIRMADLD